MPAFILWLNWTDHGVKSVKEAPKRVQNGRNLAKKFGVDIKHVYLTSGDDNLMFLVDAPNGESVAKLALSISAKGNVRVSTSRAWSEQEFKDIFADLP